MPKEKEPVELCSDTDERIVVLNDVRAGSYGGLGGDYRLLTGVFGWHSCVLYEAISGNDRYPPGRNMHVELSFDEMDALVAAYTRHRAEQEKANAKRAEASQADDFDPFAEVNGEY